MAALDAPDEIQWHAPDLAMWMGGIHENTVLHYFARSHFFDPTSNNASVETQASFNPSMAYLVQTREAFENHLRTLQGLEYIVAMGPEDFGGPAPISQGTWVIRKQNRRKRLGAEDEITVLATYFVIGENIYMAPSIGNVIGSKLLATTSALNRLFSIACGLPNYSPALGYRYLPSGPVKQKENSAAPSQPSQQSKENSPVPDSASQGDAGKSAAVGTHPSMPASSKATDPQTIYDSFSQFLRYGNEYMDERPLVGEPGSFVFANIKPPPIAIPENAGLKSVESRAGTPQRQPMSPLSPDREEIQTATTAKGSKTPDVAGSRPKAKRKKSKAPTAPGSPSNPVDIATPA